MNEQQQKEYLEQYQADKKKGLPFFPDILFKDAVVSLLVFLILVGLAYFVGAPLEERANPADTTYTPRPEWYFLFLFQLLKRFPGQLEVVGVIILPTLAILLLLALPFLDRSPKRHFLNRPVVTGSVALVTIGIVYLTIQARLEAPPPQEVAPGDETAALYTENCAPCHGPEIQVPVGANLHEIIAQGRHDEGMPAWNADLATNEIDALAGFILSPEGSKIFAQNCAACHDINALVASDPLELKQSLDEGQNYPPHADLDIPDWSEALPQDARTALLNFLAAPDGQRLFALNCSPCHGRAVAYSGEEEDLRQIISEGGLHLEMPPWRETLSDEQLDILAAYVVDPGSASQGQELFQQYCTPCHGEVIPQADTVDQARELIASGGGHETMPVWGNVLTTDQMTALVEYTLDAARGAPLEVGRDLFVKNCSPCHGEFGEGGPNPSRQGDVIAPISSAEYLKTRDDFTLKAVISQGQPNFGMSPFGTANGGPLDDEEIGDIVAYMRSWEQNPPVELPPEIAINTVSLKAAEIYQDVCAQCHGSRGEGRVGPALADPQYQSTHSDEEIFDSINLGHEATAMIAWGEILSAEQIEGLVGFIRSLEPVEPVVTEAPTEEPGAAETPPAAETPAVEETPATEEPPSGPVTFEDVLPLFDEKCVPCHGSMGGWDASTYEAVMETGDNAPVVIPGNVEDSLLAHKLLGTQTEGGIMPPGGILPEDELQLVLDWIEGGALESPE